VSSLSHAVARRTGKPTGRIKYKFKNQAIRLMRAAFAEIVRAWCRAMSAASGKLQTVLRRTLQKDMSDLYDKIREEVSFRREWAEKAGLGFEIPPKSPGGQLVNCHRRYVKPK